MTNYFEEFKQLKDEGASGKSVGIPFNLPRLNTVIPGIQKQRLTLIGGGSGSGKTKYTNEEYIFNAFEQWYEGGRTFPLEIHYMSLEMPRAQIIAALVVRWLDRVHAVLVDTAYLLGYVQGKPLQAFHNELLESDDLREYITAFEEVVFIIDTHLNHVSFEMYLKDLSRSKGVITTKSITTKDDNEINVFESYEENDDRQVTIVVLDHLGLVKRVQGQSDRAMMSDMADIIIKYRNRYKFTFVVTQQLNRNFSSTDRHKMEDVLPKDSDFRGGSGMFDASDVVLGILSPNRERLNSFMGYRISSTPGSRGLGNRFVAVNVIKNRHGSNNAVIPLLFVGESGRYEELPRDAKDFDYAVLGNYTKHY